MAKQIIIAEQHRIGAVFAEDQIQEIIVSTGQHQVCDIYLGIVENIVQGIDAAFVNLGDPSRNGFIHVTDLGPLRLRRSAGAITELLAPQQKVLVQIMKEPTGNKGPRLTGNISLPGRYVVLMPFGKGVNLSRRVRSEAERNRLRALAVLIKPAGMGMLVRTEAEGKTEEEIIEDLEQLQRQWETVEQDSTTARAPSLLNRDDDFVQRVLRDVYTSDVNRVVVDSAPAVKRVKQYLSGGGRTPEGLFIDHHRERQSILEYFRVNSAIRESLKPRVDLPSGGYIIIEPTEALTVIDVNSGSFTRSSNSRETVLWTNCEAATEIARQLRLRNIAGVIVVDFIDMDYRKDKLQVLEHFDRQLRADKARPQISQLSELGLVELTRKRQGQNIYELFGQTCNHCGGLGITALLPGETAPSTIETREFRDSRSPAPVIQRTWDHGNEPFENSPEEEENFNLANGSSYPERGRLDKRRRRRGEKPETPREDSGRPVPRGAAPLAFSNPMGTNDPPPLFPEIDEQPPNVDILAMDTMDEQSGEQSDKPQRTKPVRTPVEPPERLSVEMSEAEKVTYAWMGVSPLIKLEQEIRNPRTAIVTVVEPGSLPPVDPQSIKSQSSEAPAAYIPESYPEESAQMTLLPVFVPEPTPVLSAIGAVAQASANDEDEDEAPETESAPLPQAVAIPVPTPKIAEPPPEEIDDNPQRRKRRRSSAVISED
jgi:ribonuclease E